MVKKVAKASKAKTKVAAKAKKSNSKKVEAKTLSKTELLLNLADKTKLAKKDIANVFTNLAIIAAGELKSTGSFTVPQLVKLKTKLAI